MWESSTPKVSCTLTPYGEPFHTLFMQIPHPNPFDKQRNQSKRWKQKKNVGSCDRHLCGNAAIGGKICLAGPRTRRVFPQGQLRRRWSMAHVIRTNAGGKVTCSRTVWHLFVIFVFFFPLRVRCFEWCWVVWSVVGSIGRFLFFQKRTNVEEARDLDRTRSLNFFFEFLIIAGQKRGA